jgi:hypothetical protein
MLLLSSPDQMILQLKMVQRLKQLNKYLKQDSYGAPETLENKNGSHNLSLLNSLPFFMSFLSYKGFSLIVTLSPVLFFPP